MSLSREKGYYMRTHEDGTGTIDATAKCAGLITVGAILALVAIRIIMERS